MRADYPRVGLLTDPDEDPRESETTVNTTALPYGLLLGMSQGVGPEAEVRSRSARVALKAARRFLQANRVASDDTRGMIALLRQALKEANAELHGLARDQSDVAFGGASALLVLVAPGRAFVAHLGDCRLYLVRRGQASRITRDHTMAQTWVEHGILTDEQIRERPDSRKPLKLLGARPECEPDVRSIPIQMEKGDALVLCNAGIHECVDDDELAGMACAADPEVGAQQLCDVAASRGRSSERRVLVYHSGPPLRGGQPRVLRARRLRNRRKTSVWLLGAAGLALMAAVGLAVYGLSDRVLGPSQELARTVADLDSERHAQDLSLRLDGGAARLDGGGPDDVASSLADAASPADSELSRDSAEAPAPTRATSGNAEASTTRGHPGTASPPDMAIKTPEPATGNSAPGVSKATQAPAGSPESGESKAPQAAAGSPDGAVSRVAQGGAASLDVAADTKAEAAPQAAEVVAHSPETAAKASDAAHTPDGEESAGTRPAVEVSGSAADDSVRGSPAGTPVSELAQKATDSGGPQAAEARVEKKSAVVNWPKPPQVEEPSVFPYTEPTQDGLDVCIPRSLSHHEAQRVKDLRILVNKGYKELKNVSPDPARAGMYVLQAAKVVAGSSPSVMARCTPAVELLRATVKVKYLRFVWASSSRALANIREKDWSCARAHDRAADARKFGASEDELKLVLRICASWTSPSPVQPAP